MSLSPIPRGVYSSIYSISPKALADRGVRLVLADLDNTLAPYKVTQPSPELVAWKEALSANGIALFLLSNSRKPGRAQSFAEKLGIPCQGHSGKPKKAGYLKAMERQANAEIISKQLYPADNHREGKSLRLKQQYFFVSATVQSICRKHKAEYGTLRNFARKHVIQINDTHPTLVIPELMRILLDEEGYGWE